MSEKRRRFLFRAVVRRAGAAFILLIALSVLQVVALRFLNPPFTPLMAYGWIKGEGPEFQWRSLGEISPFLQQAVIASEDQRFYHHHGFDWRQIRRALHEHRRAGRLRGASTITMQVARNLYLWHGYSWLRKALEAYYTVLIELIWPKRRIMELYLNIAEWGPGIFGAEAAARRYYGRAALALTRPQAAMMAAVLPNPRKWSPAHPTPYLKRRQARILRQMNQFEPLGEDRINR